MTDGYILKISECFSISNDYIFKTIASSDDIRDALILFCIENNYEYDSSSWIFKIYKPK